MAVLAASIADTVAGMQRVLAKDAYSSDSDEPYLRPSNRGYKLKRKASAMFGRSNALFDGPQAYRKTIKHANYSRDIVRRNPRRYDEDGDELATEDEDEEADARAAEENPYADIRLEKLLAPLTSAAALPDHPSMSYPYLYSTLSNMVQHACNMVQKERKTLSNAKTMLTKLRGDETWIPAGKMETTYDDEIFDTSKVYDMIIATVPIDGNMHGTRTNHVNGTSNVVSQTLGEGLDVNVDGALEKGLQSSDPSPFEDIGSESTINGRSDLVKVTEAGIEDHVAINLGQVVQEIVKSEGIDNADQSSRDDDMEVEKSSIKETESFAHTNGTHTSEVQQALPVEPKSRDVMPSVENAQIHEREASEGRIGEPGDHAENVLKGSQSPPRRVTRAQAQADKVTATSRSESPDDWVPPPIHPLFLVPPGAKPDSDFGLPTAEAQETRNLLAAYVQKQEEVCRVAEKLYEGLLLADRQRQTVLKWCKAEGHVGEMSDGEDWYDKDEWGLEEDLRKGHAEEEEDTVVQGKKTRGRRA